MQIFKSQAYRFMLICDAIKTKHTTESVQRVKGIIISNVETFVVYLQYVDGFDESMPLHLTENRHFML